MPRRLILSLFFLISCVAWVGCMKEYIQVYDTQAANATEINDQWIFENDTVSIRYSFWASGGVMSFAIFNKTDRPLFVDWKNSSLIVNDHKLEYWIDETRTASVTSTVSSSSSIYTAQPGVFDWGYVLGSVASSQSMAQSEGTMVRSERITSIPPHAYAGMQRHQLLQRLLKLDCPPAVVLAEQRSDKLSSSTKVTQLRFPPTDTPLRFRNFLVLAPSEDMSGSFQIDNAFWLSEAREMDYRHFRGRYIGRDQESKPMYAKPFKTRTAFYRHLREE